MWFNYGPQRAKAIIKVTALFHQSPPCQLFHEPFTSGLILPYFIPFEDHPPIIRHFSSVQLIPLALSHLRTKTFCFQMANAICACRCHHQHPLISVMQLFWLTMGKNSGIMVFSGMGHEATLTPLLGWRVTWYWGEVVVRREDLWDLLKYKIEASGV